MIWLKFAWREISKNPRFSLFFVLNLSLGLLGFIALDTFKSSFQASLGNQSRSMLGADLAISARRPLLPDETQIINRVVGEKALTSHSVSLYTMVGVDGGSASRLVELIGVDSRYPLYGELTVEPESRLESNTVWSSRDFANQMQSKPGASLKIGQMIFTLGSVISKDSTAGFAGFSLAPRIYLSLDGLKRTGLIMPGSTLSYRELIRLPDDRADLALKELNRDLKDASVKIVSHRTASAQTGKLIDYVNDYLGLVSLVAFLLAAVGSAFLFRAFLAKRSKDIAIYLCLGVPSRKAYFIYLSQLMILGVIAASVSSLLTLGLLPAAVKWIAEYFSLPVRFIFSPRPYIFAFLLGGLGSVLLGLPFLSRVKKLNPAHLLDENFLASSLGEDQERGQVLRTGLLYLPALIALSALAVYEANSWRVGGSFAAGTVLAGLLLAGLGLGMLRWMSQLSSRTKLRLRLALRSLVRNRAGSLACFLAIGLGSLLINLIPQIEKNIATEIAQPEVSNVPSLFFFDIQSEQLGELENFISKVGKQLSGVSPLVRARLLKINNEDFEKRTDPEQVATREDEEEARARNRGFNLSYRAHLTEAETIDLGRPFSPNKSQTAEVSVEKEFANRLKIKLGDKLKFDVQGTSIVGQVVNLRKVKWTSFQPNFFIEFQPGVLDDAPKTYLASVGKLDPLERLNLQNQIVRQFPNISMIDISELVKKLLNLFSQMAWAIELMAYLSLFSGITVIFSIANQQASTHQTETQLMKILGAKFSDVLSIYTLEFIILGASASLFGGALSIVLSYGLARFVFDGLWIFQWKLPLIVCLGTSLVCGLTTLLATGRALKTPAIRILREE